MNKDQFNWISGLDQTGWVAAALFAVFFILAAFTIGMMLKINAENKKDKKKKPPGKSKPVASKPARRVPVKPEAKSPEKKNDDTDPLEQAEVYLTYGLNKQAVDLLKEHLKNNPSDKAAIELLAKAQTGV